MLCPLAMTLAMPSIGASSRPVYVASAAREHLSTTYKPAWEELFLREDEDTLYPMPAASQVDDLLSFLSETRGLAVHTQTSRYGEMHGEILD